jgi:hypothetical protein
MAILTSAGITFGDATSQTTAATAAALVTTANVLSATAGGTAASTGMYAVASTSATVSTTGSTVAGSSLRGIDACGSFINPFSGTWRYMGAGDQRNNGERLYLRIS